MFIFKQSPPKAFDHVVSVYVVELIVFSFCASGMTFKKKRLGARVSKRRWWEGDIHTLQRHKKCNSICPQKFTDLKLLHWTNWSSSDRRWRMQKLVYVSRERMWKLCEIKIDIYIYICITVAVFVSSFNFLNTLFDVFFSIMCSAAKNKSAYNWPDLHVNMKTLKRMNWNYEVRPCIDTVYILSWGHPPVANTYNRPRVHVRW